MEERVMEMLSVWFANAYYVSIYGKAVEDHFNQRFPTIEKAYRHQIESFNKSLKQQKNPDGSSSNYYPNIMNSINKQYNFYIKINNSPSQFIDMVARSFMPPDEYAEIYNDESQKREIVKAIITRTVSAFTVYVINEALADVISQKIRNSATGIQEAKCKQLKNKFHSLLNQMKNEYCNLLVAGRNGVDISNCDSRSMIPQEVVGRLEEKIRYLIEEKSAIIREKNELVQSQNKLVKQMRILLNRCRELESEHDKIINSRNTPPAPAIPATPATPTVPVAPAEGTTGTTGTTDAKQQSNNFQTMPSVQAMRSTKFKGINLVPEQAGQMHNINELDEVNPESSDESADESADDSADESADDSADDSANDSANESANDSANESNQANSYQSDNSYQLDNYYSASTIAAGNSSDNDLDDMSLEDESDMSVDDE